MPFSVAQSASAYGADNVDITSITTAPFASTPTVGDLIVHVVIGNTSGGNDPALQTPSGWTRASDVNPLGAWTGVYTRYYQAGDPTTVTFNFVSGQVGTLAVYSFDIPNGAFGALTSQADVSSPVSSPWTTNTGTGTSNPGSLQLLVFAISDAAATPGATPTGFTKVSSGEEHCPSNSGDSGAFAGYYSNSTTSSTAISSYTLNWSGSSGTQAVWGANIVINPITTLAATDNALSYDGTHAGTSDAAAIATYLSTVAGPDALLTWQDSASLSVSAATALTVSIASLTLYGLGSTAQFSAWENSYSGPITASSGATSIALVSPASGSGPGPVVFTVTAASLGTTTITVADNHGGARVITVNVLANALYTLPAGPPDVRITVLEPDASAVLVRDASGDLAGQWEVSYEKTPGGCGTATIKLGLRYEEAFARGYWTALNLVEISTGDDVLQKNISAGATKIYVSATAPYDTSTGEETPQLYFWDGATLTMGVPVTAVGHDNLGPTGSNDPYLVIGAPLTWPGNPTSMPAYGAGTIIGRRRYCGVIRRRERPKQNEPLTTITCGPLADAFNEAFGSYSMQATANVDIASALYDVISQNQSGHYPHLSISAGNFPMLGLVFQGQRQDASVLSMMADMLGAVSSGDEWTVFVGHDRTVRLLRLWIASANFYTHNVTLSQGQVDFEPLAIDVVDQDASGLYNAIKVTGATNPATNQPYGAIAIDTSSITQYKRQLDGTPVSVLGLTSDQACANYGLGLLNQQSLAREQVKLRVYTRVDGAPLQEPQGLPGGDVVRGVDAITIDHFDQVAVSANNCPDSEILVSSAWGSGGSPLMTVSASGPSGANVWAAATGTSWEDAPPFYVAPGRIFTLSAWFDPHLVTAGTLYCQAYTEAGLIGAAQFQATSGGAAGRIVGPTFTVPPGSSTLRVRFYANAITGTGKFGQPMLSDGGSDRSYQPNYAAPQVYGLASSVVTTLSARGDRYQDVTFAPIESDWSSALAETANAAAGIVRANMAPQVGTRSYVLAPSAYPPTYSINSLLLAIPSFGAEFAKGTEPIVVPATNITLLANTVTWLWVDNGGVFHQEYNSADPSNGTWILYGYAQTNATGIVGFTPTATLSATFSVVDDSGNVLAHALTPQGTLLTSGPWAGWIAPKPSSATPNGYSSVYIAGGSQAELNAYLWCEWTAVQTDPSGIKALGVGFFGAAISTFIGFVAYAGGGLVMAGDPGDGWNLYSLATNKENDQKPHTFRFGFKNAGTNQWRVYAYVDDVMLTPVGGTVVSAFMNTATCWPALIYDPGTAVYIKDAKFWTGLDVYDQAPIGLQTGTGPVGQLLNGQLNMQTTSSARGSGSNLWFLTLTQTYSYSLAPGTWSVYAEWTAIMQYVNISITTSSGSVVAQTGGQNGATSGDASTGTATLLFTVTGGQTITLTLSANNVGSDTSAIAILGAGALKVLGTKTA